MENIKDNPKSFTLTFELNNGSTISIISYQMQEGYEVYLGGRLIRTKATKQWVFELRKMLKK